MSTNVKELIYLAGPFSHPDPKVMEEREKAHCECAVNLKSQGISVYCPIAETVSLAKHGNLAGTSWEVWREHDLNLLRRCDIIYVMQIDGWKQSVGVRGEVKFALKNRIPVGFIDKDCTYVVTTDVLEMFDVKSVDDLND